MKKKSDKENFHREKNISAPLFEAVRDYAAGQPRRFHMPGHKGRNIYQLDALSGIFNLDVTEIAGLDDYHSPHGVIAEAQAQAAALMGASRARFLVNGSGGGIMAAVMSCCGAGDKIIIPRNAHRSVWSALVLSGARPVYAESVINPRFGIAEGVPLSSYQAAIEAHPEARAVLAVHPTVHGFCGDLRGLSALCREHGMTLIADEAHGAHFRFSKDFPETALDCGADMAVQSWHKTMGSLTQSSMLLLGAKYADYYGIDEIISLTTSTSPSYILMSSLDICRAHWQANGESLANNALELSALARRRLKAVCGITVLDNSDPTRLVLANDWGVSGYRFAEELSEYKIIPEMAEERTVTLILTAFDTAADIEALLNACEKIAVGREPFCAGITVPDLPLPELILTPRETLGRPREIVPFEKSVGRIAGEQIIPYPPGIPLIYTGERISGEVIAHIKRITAAGGRLQRHAPLANDEIYVLNE